MSQQIREKINAKHHCLLGRLQLPVFNELSIFEFDKKNYVGHQLHWLQLNLRMRIWKSDSQELLQAMPLARNVFCASNSKSNDFKFAHFYVIGPKVPPI